MDTKIAASILIGLPKLLPTESRYTSAAAGWVNAQLCTHVLARLRADLPRTQVQVGVTDGAAPLVKIVAEDNPRVKRELEHKALKAARLAMSDVQRLIDEPGALPENMQFCRTLDVKEIPVPDRITEFRLGLLDVSFSQSMMLKERCWEPSAHGAKISLTVEASERESEWLVSQEII